MVVTCSVLSGWNSMALYDAFYQGLTAKLKDKHAARELSSRLDDLITLDQRAACSVFSSPLGAVPGASASPRILVAQSATFHPTPP